MPKRKTKSTPNGPDELEQLEGMFKHYCDTGEVVGLTKHQSGYLRHALTKVAQGGGTTLDHPMFALWQVKYDGAKIEPFLIRCGEISQKNKWL